MSKLEETCQDYLADKNCTLWGRAFDVKDENGLEAAAQWLAEQVRGVISLRQEREEEPLPEYKGEDIEVVDDDRVPALL